MSADAALDFASVPRTYAGALRLLSLLPTNRDVTTLFEVAGEPAADLNALAMPEVRAWLARAGYADPARDLAALRCIHVAGTKGKGSVSALATAVLCSGGDGGRHHAQRAGRVGTYLSPHVVSVRERIWLDGRPIDRGLFARYTFELWERLSAAAAAADPADPDPAGPHTKPFYFRFLTLLALHVFVREGVRSAVVECGIGGEYDVTNVLPPSVVTASVVTRLGIDHVAMLGRSLDRIAWNKAGIFKPGVAAFTLQPAHAAAALAMLRTRAAEKRARGLYELDPAAVDRWPGVAHAALSGPFQKGNMALAAAAARYHLAVLEAEAAAASVPAPDATFLDPATIPAAFCAAMAAATLRARCETVRDAAAPADWLVDGAHTADSLAEVARFFAARTHSVAAGRILLFSVRDRNAGELVRAVLAAAGAPDFFAEAVFVFPPEAAAAREDALAAAKTFFPGVAVTAWDDAASAIAHIRAAAMPSSSERLQVLATGSFVLARDVLKVLDADFEE